MDDSPWPVRSSNAVTIQSRWYWIAIMSAGAESGPWGAPGVSRDIKPFNTCIRSLKKSIFTRWANRDIPCSAAGNRGVGLGFLRIRKYSAKSNFRVSVCCVVALSQQQRGHEYVVTGDPRLRLSAPCRPPQPPLAFPSRSPAVLSGLFSTSC